MKEVPTLLNKGERNHINYTFNYRSPVRVSNIPKLNISKLCRRCLTKPSNMIYDVSRIQCFLSGKWTREVSNRIDSEHKKAKN